MIDERPRDLRALLLVLGSGAAAAAAFVLALIFLRYGGLIAPDPAQAAMVAATFGLAGALSLPAIYFGFRTLRGRAVSRFNPRAPGIGPLVVLLLVWLAALWASSITVRGSFLEWSTPLTHVVGIGIPVYLLVRLVTGGLGSGSAARAWGLLTAGMWLGTGLAALAEIALALLLLLAVAAYLVLNPGQLPLFQGFAQELTRVTALPDALDALRPWLDHPEVYLFAMVVFAGLIPVIEETAKSLATWTIFDRLQAASDGFVAGALAGAGFGILEGLLASASPGAFSGATLIARAGSSLMHIAAGAWAGRGIAEFRQSRSIGSLLRGYFSALAAHGLWNGSILFLAFGGLHMGASPALSDLVGLSLMLLGAGLLVFLCVGTPIALMTTHRRLRAELSSTERVAVPDSALSSDSSGETPGIER